MIRRFLSVVPRTVRLSASILVVVGTLIGLLVGGFWPRINALPPPQPFLRFAAIGFGVGLLLSSFLAVWLLSLGYVYGDARRRAMRPVLWVFVAALVPHLLGFLLYFVMRHPLASPCPHCGKAIAPEHRFCPHCGGAYQSPQHTPESAVTLRTRAE